MKNINLPQVYAELCELQESLEETKTSIKNILKTVEEFFEEDFKDCFSSKKEPFGLVKTELDGFVVSCDIKKSVDWDQEALAKIYGKIKQHEDPSQYIKIKYDVSETAYKNWPDAIKKIFDEARTIKQGAKKIEIKQKQNSGDL